MYANKFQCTCCNVTVLSLDTNYKLTRTFYQTQFDRSAKCSSHRYDTSDDICDICGHLACTYAIFAFAKAAQIKNHEYK